jgi:hypothetical protein
MCHTQRRRDVAHAVLSRRQRHCLNLRRFPQARGKNLDRHPINPGGRLIATGRIRKRVLGLLSFPRRCGFRRNFTDLIAIDADVFEFAAVEVTQRDKCGLALATRDHDGDHAVHQPAEARKQNGKSSPNN